jgi:VIT1/CCC1 family predicted Fe2+/Mn2+ transporter
MGANDGIVSTAGMVVGVAGASVGSAALLAAGVAATVAGGLSMAVGEYVSVSSQRDALVARRSEALAANEDALTNPWYAAWASMIAFAAGALVPLLTVLLAPASIAVPVTFAAVLAALVLTGAAAAHLGDASKLRGASRTVLGGLAAMTATWLIGSFVGTQL